jgi:hypothetical protein
MPLGTCIAHTLTFGATAASTAPEAALLFHRILPSGRTAVSITVTTKIIPRTSDHDILTARITGWAGCS